MSSNTELRYNNFVYLKIMQCSCCWRYVKAYYWHCCWYTVLYIVSGVVRGSAELTNGISWSSVVVEVWSSGKREDQSAWETVEK